jgi:F0F1-type ATP synthase delta subunit
MAANERSVHLINIMQDKNCKNVDKVLAHIATTPRVQTLSDLSEAYKSLLELYKSGGLTEKEYDIQKRKVLGQ